MTYIFVGHIQFMTIYIHAGLVDIILIAPYLTVENRAMVHYIQSIGMLRKIQSRRRLANHRGRRMHFLEAICIKNQQSAVSVHVHVHGCCLVFRLVHHHMHAYGVACSAGCSSLVSAHIHFCQYCAHHITQYILEDKDATTTSLRRTMHHDQQKE